VPGSRLCRVSCRCGKGETPGLVSRALVMDLGCVLAAVGWQREATTPIQLKTPCKPCHFTGLRGAPVQGQDIYNMASVIVHRKGPHQRHVAPARPPHGVAGACLTRYLGCLDSEPVRVPDRDAVQRHDEDALPPGGQRLPAVDHIHAARHAPKNSVLPASSVDKATQARGGAGTTLSNSTGMGAVCSIHPNSQLPTRLPKQA
jgi:hypothetical protein